MEPPELVADGGAHRGAVRPDGRDDPRPDLVGPLAADVAVDDADLRAEVRDQPVPEDLVEGWTGGSEREQTKDGSLDHDATPQCVARV